MDTRHIVSGAANGELAAMSGARLSIGAVRPGWYCVDNRGGNGADLTIDLECHPWPLPDSCAVQVFMGHAVNRVNPARFGFVLLMNELWRLLVPNGELMIVSYYGINSRYCADPCACNPLTEQTLYYFDPAHKSGLWQVYQPSPWQIRDLAWQADGNLEVLLGKR